MSEAAPTPNPTPRAVTRGFYNLVRYVQTLPFVSIGLLLSGCAALTHYNNAEKLNTSNGSEATVVFIDAKQRAVVAADRGSKASDAGSRSAFLAFCAEPSPDALSALAASQGFSFSKPDVAEVAQSLAISEGASSIGLRTQSIQLMRDSMYRLCEASLSGSANGPSWQTLYRRLQSTMVAILAIEQLTGTVTAPPVAIGSSAVVGSADLLAKYTEKTEEARKKVSDGEKNKENTSAELAAAQKAVDDKTKARDSAKTTHDNLADGDPGKAAAKDALDKAQVDLDKAVAARDEKKQADDAAQADLDNRKAEFQRYDAARKSALSNTGTASVNVQIAPDECCASDSGQIRAVADNVAKIVHDTLQLDFSREACATVVTNYYRWQEDVDGKPAQSASEDEKDPAHEQEPGSILAACISYINKSADLLAARNEFIRAVSAQINAGQLPSEQAMQTYVDFLKAASEERPFQSIVDGVGANRRQKGE